MASMNFNTANATFRQLLGNGLRYSVPPFQRDYSWSEEEWDDLWQDILGLFTDDGESAHYLGYLVLQSRDQRRFEIIDGQQRLTTVSVMILAALAHLQALVHDGIDADDNRRRIEQLRHSYIGYLDPVSLVPQSKLSLSRHTDRFYQRYLVPLEPLPYRNLNASEQLLRNAFGWFQQKLAERHGRKAQSGRELAAFLDQLVDRLFFTVITVSDELNAFTVFETLNARGVRLSATDLLKNYLFSIISSGDVHQAEIADLEDRWERIVGQLGGESFPEFLRVFWNSRFALVRSSELFKTIRRQVTTRDAAFDLLRRLDQSAEVFSALRDAQDGGWNEVERGALQQLLMFGVRQPLAMLLACHRAFFSTDRAAFTRILRAVAIVSFRYNVICNRQTFQQERIYNTIARRVTDGEFSQPAQILAAMREIYPDDQEFKAAFSDKVLRTTSSRNRQIVRYMLFTIERQRCGRDFDADSAVYTLEHILPEHAGDDWAAIDGALQERLIYRLGNITLLEIAENRAIGNAGYATKREAYRRSTFQLTRAVAEHYDEWNEQKVAARQRQLANLAAGIWRIELPA